MTSHAAPSSQLTRPRPRPSSAATVRATPSAPTATRTARHSAAAASSRPVWLNESVVRALVSLMTFALLIFLLYRINEAVNG